MTSYRLRHRIDIEQLQTTRDAIGGIVESWSAVFEDVPAEIVPMSGRQFVAAQAVQSGVTTRIMIRFCDVDPTMRVNHGGVIYNIKAVLPDPTLARHINLMCETGVSYG